MDVEKGFVHNVEVNSNFCQKCSRMEKQLSPDDFAAWKETLPCFTKNFDNESRFLEVEAAVHLWQDLKLGMANSVCALNDGGEPYLAASV